MTYRILCDFDGTITTEDVTDALLERFALPSWRQVEADWQAGRITSRECMRDQIALLRVASGRLDQFLDQVAIDPGFAGFADFARQAGWELVVVSDGLDYVIHRLLGRLGLDHLPVVANHLVATGRGRYRLEFPHADPDCATGAGTCKCRYARASCKTPASGFRRGAWQEKSEAYSIICEHFFLPGNEASSPRTGLCNWLARGGDSPIRVLIGDGASDFCVAARVSMIFAKERLWRYARERGLPCFPFTGFAAIAERLYDLETTGGDAAARMKRATEAMAGARAGWPLGLGGDCR